MRQLMEADIVFISEHRPMRSAGDPNDHPRIAALIKHDFDVEVLDDSIEYWGGGDDDWILRQRMDPKDSYPSPDNHRDRREGARSASRLFRLGGKHCRTIRRQSPGIQLPGS